MSLPRIDSCMDRRTHAVRVDDNIYDVIRTLIDESVTGAVVIDDDQVPVGMIGEAECLKLLSAGDDSEVPRGTVEDFMTEVVTVKPNMDIYYVAGLFNTHPTMRRFAVVDGAGKLSAVVTRKDLLKVVYQKFVVSSA